MRIGINVPNELLKRVREIEPRVNISQVCREALEDRVNAVERAKAQATSDGIAEHVARLVESANRPMIEPDWEALALKDACHWVSTIAPHEWEQFLHQCDVLKRQGRDETEMVVVWSSRGENRGLNYHINIENSEWFLAQLELQYLTGGGPDPQRKATEEYVRAWLGYVTQVRRNIEQHYKDEYRRVMREREAERASLLKPEIPQQLI